MSHVVSDSTAKSSASQTSAAASSASSASPMASVPIGPGPSVTATSGSYKFPPRPRMIILGLDDRAEVLQTVEMLRPTIEAHGELIGVDLIQSRPRSEAKIDLVIVLGGDGSILRAAHWLAYDQVPVIGVNLGKLGFLADLSPEQFLTAFPKMFEGELRIDEHLMFDCRVMHGERVVAEQLGLNETAVLAGASFRILAVDLYVDAEWVTTYSCDGLLVSTPVGSTAHNLSAGGPLLRKDLQAFVISPISPHTLTNRPVVDSADRRYEFVVAKPHPGTAVVVDGRVLCELSPGDRVIVERAKPSFKLVAVPGSSYFRTLREKLNWGGGLVLRTPRTEA